MHAGKWNGRTTHDLHFLSNDLSRQLESPQVARLGDFQIHDNSLHIHMVYVFTRMHDSSNAANFTCLFRSAHALTAPLQVRELIKRSSSHNRNKNGSGIESYASRIPYRAISCKSSFCTSERNQNHLLGSQRGTSGPTLIQGS